MSSRPTVVVLAAGKGSRFKGSAHKLEQSLGELSVLGSTVRNAVESRLPVLVVTTRALADHAARWVDAQDVLVVPEIDGEFGMGHSIAAGVAARAGSAGWLLLPADMPLVRPATMRAVAAALGDHAVAFAEHHGRRGHPVGFSAELYSELMRLTGDEGARRIVARYPGVGVDVDDPGVLVDVDTDADLAAVRALSTLSAQPVPQPGGK